VSPSPGRAILDVCCGQGVLTELFSQAGADVAGLDFSPVLLAHAQSAAPNAMLIKRDAQSLPVVDASFDAATNNFGFGHVPDQPKALAEVARVLKPGGLFALSGWVAPERNPASGIFFGTAEALAVLSRRPAQPDFFLFSRKGESDAALSEAGLTVVERGETEHHFRFSSSDGLFALFRDGTVSASLLLRAQTDEVVAAMRDAMADKAASGFATQEASPCP